MVIYGVGLFSPPQRPQGADYLPYDDKGSHAEQENRTIADIYNHSQIDLYAYGDSITGKDRGYINQMAARHMPDAIALFNTDGIYRNSTWARINIPWHYNTSMKYFIYMFTNDGNTVFYPYPPGGIGGPLEEDFPVNLTVENYLAIYDYVKANGTVPVPMIPIITVRGVSAYSVENQTARINALESAFEQRGIFYVKMYDALDAEPMNGRPDFYREINETKIAFVDGIHPTEAGYRIMGDYLWTQLKEYYPNL